MAKLDINSSKETDHGRLYFGNKDVAYLKKLSREAVEQHNNVTLLYFALDWEASKRNVYGEMLMKKFKNPKGVQLSGIIKMNQGDETMNQGVPQKIMKLTFSCYVDLLREKDVEPKIGDYFSYGQRIYEIYDTTLKDYGPGNVIGNRERMRVDFYAIQSDDEVIQKNPFSKNLGTDLDIRKNGSIENL